MPVKHLSIILLALIALYLGSFVAMRMQGVSMLKPGAINLQPRRGAEPVRLRPLLAPDAEWSKKSCTFLYSPIIYIDRRLMGVDAKFE